MKLNKDNYELILFDLLEGNLPEEESIKLMQQIEEDEFLFNEWKLLKHTILQPEEEVVFTRKQDLLKPEETRIIPFYRIGAIAASVVILFGVFFFLNRNADPKDSPIAVEEVNPAKPKIEPANELPVIKQDSQVQAVETIVPITQPNTIVREETKDIQPVKEEKDVEEQIMPKVQEQPLEVIAQEVIDVPSSEELKEQLEDRNTPVEVDLIPKTVDAIASASNPKPRVYSFDNKQFKKDMAKSLLTAVTSASPKRIKKRVYEFVALMSNPKIRFKPQLDNKKPALQIEFETAGYEAIASIQPFKKELRKLEQ